MNIKLAKLPTAAALLFVGAMSSTPAFAQGTWTAAGSGSSCDAGPSGTSVSSLTCAVGGVSATLTAWGYTGTLSTTQSGQFQAAKLGDFDGSGLGAYSGNKESGTDSQHAFDNVTTGCGTTGATGASGMWAGNPTGGTAGCGGQIEGMLLSFTSRVSLTRIGIGYSAVDADLSLYRWDGNGAPDMTITKAATSTTTTGTLSGGGTGTGWTLVSSNDSDITDPYNTGNSLFSSYFLITTYFGASVGNLDFGNDRFKIDMWTAGLCTGALSGGSTTGGNGASCGSTVVVPTPGSVALAGLALFGIAATRRRLAARA